MSSLKGEQMADELRDLRVNHDIPVKDMVAVVQTKYPKYDKTLQSKCEHGRLYGIELKRDAMDALIAKFAQEAVRRKKSGGHRLTCRVSCRLEEGEFRLLQQHVKADRYDTMQAWLAAQIKTYLNGRESAERKE
jgi:hypothetical protein